MVSLSTGFLCSGHITLDAAGFAKDKPLELVDGEQLAALIDTVQRKPGVSISAAARSTKLDAEIPACPMCSNKMVLRTAGKGRNAGQQFWGCSRFPKCRGTRPVVTSQ